MSFELFAAFVTATVILMIIPGPNVALITANSVSFGRKFGLITVLGTSLAMVPQLALTVFGMTGALSIAGGLFEWLRWLGIGYLIILGINAWRSPAIDLTKIAAPPRSAGSIFLRGFFVSSSNPKTLLFYGAFFPQFVTTSGNIFEQLALLSISFLLIALVIDSCWAVLADRLRVLLSTRGRLRNKLTATIFFLAAAGLFGFKRSA